MNFTKKAFVSSIVGLSLCLSLMTGSVLADTSKKSVAGYGTLKGTLYGKDYTTSVTKNPDKAYLIIKGSMQDKNGKTLVSTQQIKSSRGKTSFSGDWSNISSNVYVIYGTHGVQGGNKYGAAAVYTYTHR
ncbi:hypothetical protein KQI76_04885 [Amphibacillus sp. MSJ-3]|uniref:hypothetical protein n=1 Tax=Amphibacillus sp. MSJ-3 TaxID=2841505 RepID=UPI001C0EDB6E|nr:hypothetical protein [Amphibacillus sp. MSJ-3]MBU5594492.1 hypothetical protein [Amphibacillus sp. MSJ-3]